MQSLVQSAKNDRKRRRENESCLFTQHTGPIFISRCVSGDQVFLDGCNRDPLECLLSVLLC